MMNEHGILFGRVHPSREGRNEPNNIGRTAGTVKDSNTLRNGKMFFEGIGFVDIIEFWVNFQRIFVEERFSVHRKSGENAVVDRPLKGIRVDGFRLDCLHSAGKHSQRNGCAGLGVGTAVGKMIIYSKGLTHMGRSGTAGDIHTLINNIAEYTATGIQQRIVLVDICDVGHTAKQILRPNTVTVCGFPLAQGNFVLVVA